MAQRTAATSQRASASSTKRSCAALVYIFHDKSIALCCSPSRRSPIFHIQPAPAINVIAQHAAAAATSGSSSTSTSTADATGLTTTCTLLGATGSHVFLEETLINSLASHTHQAMLHRYDAEARQWESRAFAPRGGSMVRTTGYCAAACGKFLYVAGGLQRLPGISGWKGLRCVERLAIVDEGVMQWEVLPDMRIKRADAAMAVLKGCIYVIGGKEYGEDDVYQGLANSGEVWDPVNGGDWTLVPELCPAQIFGRNNMPKLAVAMDTLFAVPVLPPANAATPYMPELVQYVSRSKSWSILGPIGGPSATTHLGCRAHCHLCAPAWACHQLLAVEQELWVVLVRFCGSAFDQLDHKRITFVTYACSIGSWPLAWTMVPDAFSTIAGRGPLFTTSVELPG